MTAAERPLPKALDRLARSTFEVGRLEPVPGWRFGQWNRNDPRAWVRRLIWQVAQARGYDGPVVTDWYLGLKLNHHLTGDISRCTFVDGRYEPNEMYAMNRAVGEGMCVVDAVMANISINGLSNVKVHAQALGRAAGRSTLRVAAASHSGHNTMGRFMYATTVQEESIDVDVVTLDQAAKEQMLTRIDLLKIDVEGSEGELLRGATDVLRSLRPVVLAEAQDASLRQMGSSVAELLELLRSHDYEVQFFGPSGRPEPLVGDEPSSLNLLCVPAESRTAQSR